jgi:hypothetical protein
MKKQLIKNLLKRNIFILARQKKNILLRLDKYSEKQLKTLYNLLITSKEKQDFFIKKSLKNNFNLKLDIQNFKRIEILKAIKNKEKHSRKMELQKLKLHKSMK